MTFHLLRIRNLLLSRKLEHLLTLPSDNSMASVQSIQGIAAGSVPLAAANGIPQSFPDASVPKHFMPEWAHCYPTGIPHNYVMVYDAVGGLPEFYVENYLPTRFYSKPCKPVQAIFSTEYSSLAPRIVENPQQKRHMRLWDARKIQNTANSIRKKY